MRSFSFYTTIQIEFDKHKEVCYNKQMIKNLSEKQRILALERKNC